MQQWTWSVGTAVVTVGLKSEFPECPSTKQPDQTEKEKKI